MRLQQPLRASALPDLLGPDLVRDPLPGSAFGLRLLSLDAPHRSSVGSLVCVGRRVPMRIRARIQASLLLVEQGAEEGLPDGMLTMGITSLSAALWRILIALTDRWDFETPYGPGPGNAVHPTAVVDGVLEGDVVVGPGVYVAAGSFIGRGSRLEARCTVLPRVIIGRNCELQSGVVVGCAGFGFWDSPKQGVTAMPHLAGVHIGDNVFLGAQTVVAAGVIHPTSIGNGCKIDSHVQIAHNVELGADSLLASQSGIAGSTRIGPGLRMGGAASISGHLLLGENVTVAACSAVTKDLESGAVVAGFPAKPIREWRRQEAALRRLGTSQSQVD